MIVIVCGNRSFKDWPKLQSSLDYWNARLNISTIIHDGHISVDPSEHSLPWAKRSKWGAAHLASRWAELRRVRCVEVKLSDSELKQLGPRAPETSFRRMLAKMPQRVIDISGGGDTADILRQARAASVRCIEVV